MSLITLIREVLPKKRYVFRSAVSGRYVSPPRMPSAILVGQFGKG